MDTSLDNSPILVGIDDSPGSRTALLWAIDEASRRRAPLHVVHAWYPLQQNHHHAVRADTFAEIEHLATHANAVLAAALRQARAIAPELDLQGSLAKGRPNAMLMRHAAHARMLVVGSRNLGGLVELPLGAVGVHIASHAPCSVAIVRGNPRKTGPVIAGVHGRRGSDDVIETALDEALLRHTSVVARWVLNVDGRPDDVEDPALGDTAAIEAAVLKMHELLDRWCPKYPTVTAKVEIPASHAATAIVRASATSQLLVIGSGNDGSGSDQGEYAATNLGATTHSAIHHAHCPVLVVRNHIREA